MWVFWWARTWEREIKYILCSVQCACILVATYDAADVDSDWIMMSNKKNQDLPITSYSIFYTCITVLFICCTQELCLLDVLVMSEHFVLSPCNIYTLPVTWVYTRSCDLININRLQYVLWPSIFMFTANLTHTVIRPIEAGPLIQA